MKKSTSKKKGKKSPSSQIKKVHCKGTYTPCLIIFICLAFLNLACLFVDTALAGLVLIPFVIEGIFLYNLWGNENTAYIKWFMCLPGIFTLAHLGALTNFPPFIRSIPGTDFIGMWWIYALIVAVASFVICRILTNRIARDYIQTLQPQDYTDEDLMAMQSFTVPERNGYYVLKAKLHNLITVFFYEDASLNDPRPMVGFVDEKLEKIPKSYAPKNLFVSRILSFIRRKGAERRQGNEPLCVPLKDLLKRNPVFPDLSEEKQAKLTEAATKYAKLSVPFAGVTSVLLFYPLVAKLFMGIYNHKASGNLILLTLAVGIVLFIVMAGIISNDPDRQKHLATKAAQDLYARKEQPSAASQAEKAGLGSLTVAECTDILRAYVAGRYKLTDYAKLPENRIFTKEFLRNINLADADIRAAKKAAEEKKRSETTSYASHDMYYDCGCSSCGGGGGGGGGCGGCGDD